VAALREALLSLPAGGIDEVLTLVDADFAHWPLGEPPVLAALTDWVRARGHRVRMIGLDFDSTARQLPRFAAWRRDWAHRFEAWQPEEAGDLPTLLLWPGAGLELLDPVRWLGRRVQERAAWQALVESCDAKLQRCVPAWPATTLGL
ncbi:MAG: hypothetical protein HY021_11560, partial [Burkholderiales bacterium]|nr:hypothetical protein [Burkholderiales bacterium]